MWAEPIVLPEYESVPLPEPWQKRQTELEAYLDEVWESRRLFYADDPALVQSNRQPFLSFKLQKGQPQMKAGKYVGFLQFEGVTLQIIPKLFEKMQVDEAYRHLLWWMDYSQRFRLPFADLTTGSEPVRNFPEALIRYFAHFTHRLVSTQPYHQYEEQTHTMPYLRGRLNTQQYANTSLSRGNWHQLVCDHEPFQHNNRLNQIIRHVTKRLIYLCRPETRRELERITFVLDEVDDVPCTARDCDNVQLNRFFQSYRHCLDLCRFFLSDSLLNRRDDQQRHFCFLVPMDLVFEDFVAGICGQHLSSVFEVIAVADAIVAEGVTEIPDLLDQCA